VYRGDAGADGWLFVGPVDPPWLLVLVDVAPVDGGATIELSPVSWPTVLHSLRRDGMTPERLAEETTKETSVAWEEVERDTDGDGWTDRFEDAVATDPGSADTDGDTVTDPWDPAPRGSRRPADGCSKEAALVEALFARLAVSEEDVPVFLAGPPAWNLQYGGYPAPIIFLPEPEDEGRPPADEQYGDRLYRFEDRWCDSGWRHDCESVDDPADAARISDDGLAAQIEVIVPQHHDARTSIRLRCLDNRWYPASIHQHMIL
jgi:hypothetical protein